MYAVFTTGGRQFRAVPGEVIRVEKLEAEPGSSLDIDRVLMIGDGENVTIGTPTIKGAKVSVKVRAHGRDDKVRIIKFRRRKHHRKEMGHRQHYTEIEITGITAG
jgi:large subunit ribosomal protein L21